MRSNYIALPGVPASGLVGTGFLGMTFVLFAEAVDWLVLRLLAAVNGLSPSIGLTSESGGKVSDSRGLTWVSDSAEGLRWWCGFWWRWDGSGTASLVAVEPANGKGGIVDGEEVVVSVGQCVSTKQRYNVGWDGIPVSSPGVRGNCISESDAVSARVFFSTA